jgi:hypothetical protein
MEIVEQKVENIFCHIDQLHETNLDLAMQYMNSLSQNEKKLKLILKLQRNKKKR